LLGGFFFPWAEVVEWALPRPEIEMRLLAKTFALDPEKKLDRLDAAACCVFLMDYLKKRHRKTAAQLVAFRDDDFGVMIVTQRARFSADEWEDAGRDSANLEQFMPQQHEEVLRQMIEEEYGMKPRYVTTYKPDRR